MFFDTQTDGRGSFWANCGASVMDVNGLEGMCAGSVHCSPPAPAISLATLTGVAYLNNLWLCGGADGVMFYSVYGLTWTACAGEGVGSYVKITWTPGLGEFLSGTCNSVAASATLFVAYGLENLGPNMMRVSTDGITWTLAPNPPPTNFGYSIAVNPEGNFWVSSGEGARLYYSTDGLNWTNSGFTAVGSMYLAYDGVKFVGLGEGIGGANKDSAISYDGVNWGNNVGPKYFNERASCIATNSARGFLCTGRLL